MGRGLPDDQRTGLDAAWSLSVEQAVRLPPTGLARPTLELAAMGDPNGIPAAVLTSAPALGYLNRRREDDPGGSEASAGDAEDALRCLHRLSLADFDPGTPDRPASPRTSYGRTAGTRCCSGPGAVSAKPGWRVPQPNTSRTCTQPPCGISAPTTPTP